MKREAAAALLTAALLTSCANPSGVGQRVAFDALATGVGGTAAYVGGNGDPALTTAGAVGGFVVSEGFQAIARSGRRKAYLSGIEEGKAIGQEQILKGIWEESNGLPKGRKFIAAPATVMVPARVQNGVRYDAHPAPTVTLQPKKILIPALSPTNAVFSPHYETFQTPEAP